MGNNNDFGSIWIGDGRGGYSESVDSRIQGVGVFTYNWAKPAVADYTGDGKPDVAAMYSSTRTGADTQALRIYPGLGGGTFGEPIYSSSEGQQYIGELKLVDSNSDGHIDILGAHSNGMAAYLGDGAGNFKGVQDVLVPRAFTMATGDLDGDRSVDLIFSAQVSSPNPSRLVARLNLNQPADTTPPLVTGSVNRQPDANGWYNRDATIKWQATDPMPSSGIPTIPLDTTANIEGRSVIYTSKTSCDPAGNCITGTLRLDSRNDF